MNTFRKIVSFALSVFMIFGSVAILSSCGKGTEDWPVDEASGLTELLIGGIGPTTGDYSNYGISVKKGAQLAVDEINAAGGVNGFKLVLNFQDSAANPESAVSAYGNLMDAGMKVSLGAVLSGETASVVAAAKEDGILILTPSASSESAIAGNDNAFRVCFSDPYQGIAAAQYVADYNLATKVAVFYGSDNDYCVGLYENFKNKCAELNIEIVTVQTFTNSTNTDFSTQINAIRDSGAELVFMPIYAAEAASFLTQAKKTNALDGIRCFGCDGLDGLLTKIDNAEDANGVLMLTPFTADSPEENVSAFVANYKKNYNNEVPDQFAADGYDAVYAIAEALKNANITSSDKDNFNTRIVGAMTKITVNGLTGSMKWTADGEISKAAKLMEFENGVVVNYAEK